jgi:hypothetical protein
MLRIQQSKELIAKTNELSTLSRLVEKIKTILIVAVLASSAFASPTLAATVAAAESACGPA